MSQHLDPMTSETESSNLKKRDEQTFEVIAPPAHDQDQPQWNLAEHYPPNHPHNLSSWRKFGILVTLCFSGFLANYGASAHLTAFGPMAAYFDRPVGDIANTIGYGQVPDACCNTINHKANLYDPHSSPPAISQCRCSLLGIAVGPVLWNPLSQTVGRRYTYLIGSLLYLPCIVWCAESKSYVSFAVARVFAGLCSAFSQTVPPATIADIYPRHVRGDKLSAFGVAVIIAPALSPLIGSLVVNKHAWQNIYWIVLGLGGLQLLMFLLLVPETLWNEDRTADAGTGDDRDGVVVVRQGRVGPAWYPWRRPKDFATLFTRPIAMSRFLAITLPSIYYGSLFGWSVGITIIGPRLFEAPPYDFKPIPTGCTYLAFGLGAVLGKWSGGLVGDVVVTRVTKRNGGIRKPEYRLWALLPILPFMFVGLFIVGITFEKRLAWIAPLIGGALFYFCLSASTGILQTYVLESYITRPMDTQASFIFWKCIWGFAIPFFVWEWGLESTFTVEYAIQGVLATCIGLLLCGGLIWKGEALRRAQGMPIVER